MKNKKNRLALILVALVLFLGVGYAVVSENVLTISGTAKTVEKNIEVHFTTATAPSTNLTGASRNGADSKAAAATASTTEKSDTATLTVENLEKVGDTVTATYTIKNYETDVAASVIETSIDNDKEEFFEVTTDMTTAKSLAAQATTTVTVTVKLIKTPVAEEDSTATFTIELTASPATA